MKLSKRNLNLDKLYRQNILILILLTHIFGTSASGKPPAFGAGIPQVRILSSQLFLESSGVINDGV